mmetsp:Transcript_23362/g.51879  ORF Transcript_23362/g.51879 Transcript_23362/m.51879 type:complete len:290 (-) Transcript_23362:1674-2543(-)
MPSSCRMLVPALQMRRTASPTCTPASVCHSASTPRVTLDGVSQALPSLRTMCVMAECTAEGALCMFAAAASISRYSTTEVRSWEMLGTEASSCSRICGALDGCCAHSCMLSAACSFTARRGMKIRRASAAAKSPRALKMPCTASWLAASVSSLHSSSKACGAMACRSCICCQQMPPLPLLLGALLGSRQRKLTPCPENCAATSSSIDSVCTRQVACCSRDEMARYPSSSIAPLPSAPSTDQTLRRSSASCTSCSPTAPSSNDKSSARHAAGHEAGTCNSAGNRVLLQRR